MNLSDLPIFFLDLQTTGATPKNGHILQMAWGDLRGDVTVSHVVQLPDGGYLPKHIKEITGISDEQVLAAPALATITCEFHSFLKKVGEINFGVIHYAQFEKPFIEKLYADENIIIPFEILCTHKIAKKLLPNLPTRGIKGLAGYFGYTKDDVKDSADHIHATRAIWTGLTTLLAQKDILTSEDLTNWLNEKSESKPKGKYEYPLPKEKRLGLPQQPGVYRMLNKNSDILYVGKATSLKDRVNSYFRGQKGRDAKKLEMLTQVWDLKVTPCRSALEAALLETDEIKKHDPPYNINLKTGTRRLIFYNKDFTAMSEQQNEKFSVGPFSSPWILDSLLKLHRSVLQNPEEIRLNERIFFDPTDAEILKNGFSIFCEKHDLNPKKFTSFRHILALGLTWHRKKQSSEETSSEEIGTDQDMEMTAEDVADRFERHFIRGAWAYWRSKQLTRLLNSQVTYFDPLTEKFYNLMVHAGALGAPRNDDLPKRLHWAQLDVNTYDRMSILYAELSRLPREQRQIQAD